MLKPKIHANNVPVRLEAALARAGAIARLIFVFALLAAGIAAAADSADPKRYLDDIKALSAPSMEGRGAGTQGIARAMHLIEQRYRSLGLQPAGRNSYLQPFTVITGAQLKEGNRLEVQNGAVKKELKLNQDFVPFSFSSSGEISGPVVFRRIWRVPRRNSTTTTMRTSM